MKFRRLSRLLAVSAAVAAVVFLAGCPRAVKTPISFAAGDLTLTLPAMVIGTAISAVVLPEASGGEGAFTYALAPEVPGLTFDPETRQLSGTPTAAGIYPLRYTATDEDGDAATLSFTVTVRPTLWGSWHNTHGWGDGGTEVETRTFTNSRYIIYRSYYHKDGSFDGSWQESGTWTASDDTVTRTWYYDDDGDPETPRIRRSLDSDYVWADEAHNVLFIPFWEPWPDTHVDPGFRRYERVQNVSPSSVVGVWQRSDMGDDWSVVDTLTVNADGTLLYENSWSGRESGGVWEMTANWQLVEDEYYLNLTDASATWTPTGGVPEPDSSFLGASRFAYAPTHQWPDEMIVSPFWHEDPAYGDRNYREFGNYWMTLQRQ